MQKDVVYCKQTVVSRTGPIFSVIYEKQTSQTLILLHRMCERFVISLVTACCAHTVHVGFADDVRTEQWLLRRIHAQMSTCS